MDHKKEKKQKAVWLIVLLLLILVALSTVAIVGLLNVFMPDDEGAVSLVDTEPQTDRDPDGGKTPAVTTRKSGEDGGEEPAPTTTSRPPVTGFVAYDDQGVWNRKTEVAIFKVSYENGEAAVTVQSTDGQEVIAPGTENSYVFKLKNPGEVAMDYTLEVDAYFAPEGIEIPVTARLCRYDRKWIVGGKDRFDSVAWLDKAKDNATLGAGRYTYYTLDWSWPFEGESDELDTLLGNLATEQELTFTVVLHTIARASDDPNAGGGILPQTGDAAQPVIWGSVAAVSLVLIFLPLIPAGKKRENQEEA